MKISRAKQVIFNDIAKHGEVTDLAMRVFINHRISYEVFNRIKYRAITHYLSNKRVVRINGRKNVGFFLTDKSL